MSVLSSPNFLRNVLFADAASCVGCGALQLAAPDALAGLLGLPAALLVGTGLFLLVYAAAVAFLGSRRPVPQGPLKLVVAGNLGWAAACVALLASGAVAATALGVAYVLIQAFTVVVMAELQWFGLRSRSRAAAVAC